MPNLLLQLWIKNFTATAKVKFIPNRTEAYKEKDKVLGESVGMIMQGMDYAALKFVDTKEEGVVLQYVTCEKAEKGKAEKMVEQIAIKTSKQPQPYTVKYAVDDIPSSRIATQDVWLRVKVHSKALPTRYRLLQNGATAWMVKVYEDRQSVYCARRQVDWSKTRSSIPAQPRSTMQPSSISTGFTLRNNASFRIRYNQCIYFGK